MSNTDSNPDRNLDQGTSSVKPDTPGKPPQTPKPDPNHPFSHPPRVVGNPQRAEPDKARDTNKGG